MLQHDLEKTRGKKTWKCKNVLNSRLHTAYFVLWYTAQKDISYKWRGKNPVSFWGHSITKQGSLCWALRLLRADIDEISCGDKSALHRHGSRVRIRGPVSWLTLRLGITARLGVASTTVVVGDYSVLEAVRRRSPVLGRLGWDRGARGTRSAPGGVALSVGTVAATTTWRPLWRRRRHMISRRHALCCCTHTWYDRLTELCVLRPLDTKQVISETFPQANLGLVWKKLNLTQQMHAFTNQRNVLQHKKRKPGLVTFYDIQPGNGAGLFR